MAPALTSHSFRRLIATPHPKLNPRPHQKSPTHIFCRKPNPASSETNKPNRFIFDLPKFPDPKSTSLFSIRLRKDPNTVFVAGATGQSGARIVLTLLRQGFSVRAGVPDIASAQDLARLAVAYRTISPEESRRLNAVESSFADPESIAKAIGQATKAVVTVGSGENGPAGDVTADDALSVVRAAGLAGVGHVAVVYDSRDGGLGSGQFAYNVFNGITSFFSNFFMGDRPLTIAELLAKLVETDGVAYTLVKARLTEDYGPESSYALVLGKEGSSSDGTTTLNNSKVSKSQIAKLVADVFSNTSVAENKVLEVSTDASASSKPVAELLSAIPEDGRRKAYAEAALAKAKAKEEAIKDLKKTRKAETGTYKKLEEEAKRKLSEQQTQAVALAEEAGSTLEGLFSKAKVLGEEFSWQKLGSNNDKPRSRIASVRGQAKASILPPRKAVLKQQASKPNPKQKQEAAGEEGKAAKAEVRSVFGGLFKQEVIYMDDD